MIQYEYKVITTNDEPARTIEIMLNDMGKDCWELINVTGGPTVYYYFFKRENLKLLNS